MSQQLAYETECELPHLNHHLSSRTAAEGRTVKYQKTGSYAVNSIHGGSIMEKVYDKCCGIDVHKKLIIACFKKGNQQEIREFGATTRELLEMADWLSMAAVKWLPWKAQPPIGNPYIISLNLPV